MRGIALGEWLTIAAIIIGPILAVQAQRFLESLRDLRNRRSGIFHSLMATRAARVSHQHVQALNMIDIEFYGRRILGTQFQTRSEKAVTNAWRIYGDHLNNRVQDDQLPRWWEEGDKLLAKLLYELSRSLGYDFDEVQLRRNVYSPIAHGKLEEQEATIRSGLAKVFSNQQAIAVEVYTPKAEAPQPVSAVPPDPTVRPSLPATPGGTGPDAA